MDFYGKVSDLYKLPALLGDTIDLFFALLKSSM
jgi:hypothetical protein